MYLGVDPNADPTDADVLQLPESFFNYDVSGSKNGMPMGDEIVFYYIFVRSCLFPMNLTGSIAKTFVAPTNDMTFLLQKNGATVGYLIFDHGTTIARFATVNSLNIAFNATDVLTIVAPSQSDTSFYSLFFTLRSSLI